mmetsp:Transcript_31802/g.72350  ORF Transcript_31802/g.72350 Transcript_31802/m.72350 type:complete len:165 (-) Transcript_31802:115-609(-)
MSSTLFSTNEVVFGGARFPNARVGYNAAARCLNLLVPGARCGAIELFRGLEETSCLCVEGTKCTLGKAQHVAVIFATEDQARVFQSRISGGAGDLPASKREAAMDAATPKGTALATSSTLEAEPAPSTPPARGAAARQVDVSPPRAKRAKAAVLGTAADSLSKK